MPEPTADLFQFFIENPRLLDPTTRLIPIVFLTLCRLVPIVHLSMFLGARTLPIPVKIGIALGLFIFVLPTVLITSTSLNFGLNVFVYLFKELLIGLLIGILLAIPFYTVMIAGMIIDNQRGASSLMGTDPVLSVQDSPFGILFVYVLTLTYWSLDIPFIYIDAIAHSFELIPLDHFLPANIFNPQAHTFVEFKRALSNMFRIGIELASPALIILLMIDMFLGISNRLAPQVMISFLAQALKAMLGIFIIWFGWYHFLDVFAIQAQAWTVELRAFIYLLIS